jgi:large repetitive protein
MKTKYIPTELSALIILTIIFVFTVINSSWAQSIRFSADSLILVGSDIKGMVCADFDNDNAIDMAVSINNDQLNNPLNIFMNDGNGLISSVPDSLYPNANYLLDIAACDLNNDNIIDLACTSPNDSGIWLFSGNGDGSFTIMDSIKMTTETWVLTTADFNQDNNSDIVLGSRFGLMFIINGNGDGTFAAPVQYNSGGTTSDIEINDLNVDGFPDLIIGLGNTPSMSVFINDGTGNFPVRSSYHTYRTPGSIESCFFDSDTILDIIAGSGSWNYDNLLFMSGDISGSFTLEDTLSPCGYITDISIGDYNSDSNCDIAVGDRDGLYLIQGNGFGSFVNIDTIDFILADYRTKKIKSADINLDGLIDLLVARDSYVSVYYNLGISSNSNLVKTNFPLSFKLYQNYPNPFNPTTVISYQLPVTSNVDLSVFNINGQKVVTLISKMQGAGKYNVDWNAKGFSSGTYYFKLTVGNKVQIRKMMLLK